jgi:hypothetical protein
MIFQLIPYQCPSVVEEIMTFGSGKFRLEDVARARYDLEQVWFRFAAPITERVQAANQFF